MSNEGTIRVIENERGQFYTEKKVIKWVRDQGQGEYIAIWEFDEALTGCKNKTAALKLVHEKLTSKQNQIVGIFNDQGDIVGP